MGWSLFGGGSDSTSNVTTNNTTQNMQTAMQGNLYGTFAAPGSTITGLSGTQVEGLINMVGSVNEAGQKALSDIGNSLTASMQAQSQELAQIVAATKTPEANSLAQLAPILMLGLLLWALKKA